MIGEFWRESEKRIAWIGSIWIRPIVCDYVIWNLISSFAFAVNSATEPTRGFPQVCRRWVWLLENFSCLLQVVPDMYSPHLRGELQLVKKNYRSTTKPWVVMKPRCYNPTDSVYLRTDSMCIMPSGSTSHLEQKSSRMKVIAHIQSTLWHLIYIKLSENKIFDCYVSMKSMIAWYRKRNLFTYLLWGPSLWVIIWFLSRWSVGCW